MNYLIRLKNQYKVGRYVPINDCQDKLEAIKKAEAEKHEFEVLEKIYLELN